MPTLNALQNNIERDISKIQPYLYERVPSEIGFKESILLNGAVAVILIMLLYFIFYGLH